MKFKVLYMESHKVVTTWKCKIQFHSTNHAGELFIDAGEESGGESKGLRPKALMLTALAGCSGIDVAGLIKKMKLEVKDFRIDVEAELTDVDPKIYHKV